MRFCVFLALHLFLYSSAFAQTRDCRTGREFLKPDTVSETDSIFPGLKIRSLTYGIMGMPEFVTELEGFTGARMESAGSNDDGYFTAVAISMPDGRIYDLFRQHYGIYRFIEAESQDAMYAIVEPRKVYPRIQNFYVYNRGPISGEAFVAGLLVGLRKLKGRAYRNLGAFSTKPYALCLDVDQASGILLAKDQLRRLLGSGHTFNILPEHSFESYTPPGLEMR